MRKLLRPLRHVLPLAVLFLAAALQPAHAQKMDVVASFSILGDLAAAVGGERVTVHSLVGPDQDAHGFQPRPSDARRVGAADLVIANGLGFDAWMERLARSAGAKRPVLIASRGIRTLETAHEEDHEEGHEGGHDHGHHDVDPHAWQDVANAIIYVRNIADALAAADPEGAALYRANAERYAAELQTLDAEIRNALATVPPQRRKVVTSHDAFAYFGRAYGVRFLAAHGVASEAEPSARDIARLIRQIRAEQVPAAFLENVVDPRLVERIRSEGGARLGGTLYSDALSAGDGPASTYVALMRHNLATLLAGLRAEE
ncbi:metal ABC transporter substrate-binding protein [Pseudothauera rhizosphaerae]|uniref:Metal ABC transporter substrate-binding protein n=1 Tax=Pseudothauera rhizosphaerae TaxID=2565932 RepID=A0A4S4B031_9RHOO|nr:metal ABC transporter substrate-binding protein [Pseudothauera rhizosphaerae]THF65359.1 metal ABC transporter substrate-binding protein [Pseudothauera rhizosphaerae]